MATSLQMRRDASLVRSEKAFWPSGNRFYGSARGIAPGETAVLNIAGPGGLPIATGIFVLYADERSFTFSSPEGHILGGWITFSAYEEDGATVAQVQALFRGGDVLYELGFMTGMAHKAEDTFWGKTLGALAAHFGAASRKGIGMLGSTCVWQKSTFPRWKR